MTGREHLDLLRAAHREAASTQEKVVSSLALAAADEAHEALVEQLRGHLAQESFLYNRLTRDDIIDILLGSKLESAQAVAEAWQPV